MRSFKHKWKIAFAGIELVGLFVLATNTHRTTQAAAPPAPRAVVESVSLVETRPIVPAEIAEAARGSDMPHSANKTGW